MYFLFTHIVINFLPCRNGMNSLSQSKFECYNFKVKNWTTTGVSSRIHNLS